MPLFVSTTQSLTYVGNCEFEETEDYGLSIDEFGMDKLTRIYAGRKDKLGEFLRSFKVNTPDPEYPQLTLTTRDAQVGRAFAYVTLSFLGLFDDVLPPVIEEGGWRHQEVTLQKEDSNETLILAYKAPVTTYRYIVRKKPRRQRYAGQLSQTDLGFEIVERRGSKGKLRISGGGGLMLGYRPLGDADKNYFFAERQIVTSAFTFKPAGRYWEVTEENEGRLVERETPDKPRVLMFGGYQQSA